MRFHHQQRESCCLLRRTCKGLDTSMRFSWYLRCECNQSSVRVIGLFWGRLVYRQLSYLFWFRALWCPACLRRGGWVCLSRLFGRRLTVPNVRHDRRERSWDEPRSVLSQSTGRRLMVFRFWVWINVMGTRLCRRFWFFSSFWHWYQGGMQQRGRASFGGWCRSWIWRQWRVVWRLLRSWFEIIFETFCIILLKFG